MGQPALQNACINRHRILARIIGTADGDLGKAFIHVKRAGRVIVGGDLKKGAVAIHGQGGQPIAQQGTAKALALVSGGDGKGQQFGFARDGPGQGKATGAGKKLHEGAVEQAGELRFLPRPVLGKGGGMKGGKLCRCHGSSTGAASRAGAASAGRR